MPASAFGKPVTPILQPGGIATGLVFGAPIYEGGGTTVNDLSGQNNNGTLNSTGVTWTDGAFGKCLSFAGGASDYVSVPAAMIGALPNSPAPQATVACWFRPTSSLTAYQSLFDSTTGGAGGRQLSAFLGGVANHLFTGIAGTSGVELTLPNSWALNDWNFLAITCAGTQATTNVYQGVPGSGLAVHNCQFDTGVVGSAFAADVWQIGGNPSGGGAAFVGQQDSPLVYGRVLSAGEIAAIYADSFVLYRPPSRIFVSTSSTVSGAGTADGVATATGVGASIAASAGSASGAATASGVGASITASAGTADGSATASAVGASTALSAGTADGAATASAVGTSTVASAGTADGVATAAGVATGTAPTAGTADGAATATGVGVGISSAVGTAIGAATVAGNGASVAAALGTASGTSTAVAVSNNAPVVVCPPTPFAVSTSRTGTFGCSTSVLDYVNGSTSATGSFLVGC